MGEIKPEDTAYVIPENLQYDPIIRKLKVSDPAHAETIFNPLFQQIINNIHAVKLSDDTKAKEDLSNVLDSVFLEKVKAVGGSESGLDADTVDGKHASDFAPSGFGLGTSCIGLPTGTDLNNLPEKYKFATGFYMMASPANKPEEIGGGWVYLLQMAHYASEPAYIAQQCMELNSKKEAGNIFIRQCVKGEWTAWKKPDASTIGGKSVSELQDYNNLANKPAIPTAQVQSDWNITDVANKAFIKNKPSSMPANGGNASTVGGKSAAELQNYNNLANRPALKAVATTGSYNDLTDKPTIPTTLPANGGDADTVDGKHAKDFIASDDGHEIGASYVAYGGVRFRVDVTENIPVAKALEAETLGGKNASVLYSNCSATAPTAYLGDNVQYQVY